MCLLCGLDRGPHLCPHCGTEDSHSSPCPQCGEARLSAVVINAFRDAKRPEDRAALQRRYGQLVARALTSNGIVVSPAQRQRFGGPIPPMHHGTAAGARRPPVRQTARRPRRTETARANEASTRPLPPAMTPSRPSVRRTAAQRALALETATRKLLRATRKKRR